MLDLQNKNTSFSNTSGSYVSKEEIDASVKLTQQLIASRAAAKAAEAETGCHRPILMIGKKKKAYENCMASAQKIKADAEKSPVYMPPVYVPLVTPKFLGMEQSTGITVVVISSAAVLFGLYMLLKPKTT